MKKINIQMFEKGKIANALGKTLKLNSGPDRAKSCILIPSQFAKCPR